MSDTITIYMPPEDYNHPAVDPKRKVGDKVRDLVMNYGTGTIVKVHKTYRNRADKEIKRKRYEIKLDDWGTILRFGYEVELVEEQPRD